METQGKKKKEKIPKQRLAFTFSCLFLQLVKELLISWLKKNNKKRKSEMPIKSNAKLGSVYFRNTFFIAFLKANSCKMVISRRAWKEET